MNPENHYIDEEDEKLLNDPDFLEALSAGFESDDDDYNDENEILEEYGY